MKKKSREETVGGSKFIVTSHPQNTPGSSCPSSQLASFLAHSLCLKMSFHGSPPSSPSVALTSNMISGEVKRTEKITWTPYLREYISNGYAEHPDLYTDDFRLLDELRNDCIHVESNEKALNRLIK